MAEGGRDPSTDPTAGPRPGWRSWLLPGLLSLLLVAVLALVGALLVDRARGHDATPAPTAADVGPRGSEGHGASASAIDVARRAARTYFTLDRRTTAQVGRMRTISTPAFAATYAARVARLRSAVRAQGLRLSVELPADGTATEYLSGGAALVLVSVDVTRRSTAGTMRISLATRVRLSRDETAHRWLVSGIDQLP